MKSLTTFAHRVTVERIRLTLSSTAFDSRNATVTFERGTVSVKKDPTGEPLLDWSPAATFTTRELPMLESAVREMRAYLHGPSGGNTPPAAPSSPVVKTAPPPATKPIPPAASSPSASAGSPVPKTIAIPVPPSPPRPPSPVPSAGRDAAAPATKTPLSPGVSKQPIAGQGHKNKPGRTPRRRTTARSR